MSTKQPAVRQGDVIAGKYRIEQVLGRGGMGVVVAATHMQLGDRVALKFLLPEALEQPIAVERFLREARAAVRIKSEHVARVTDVGTLDNGLPYMVMELLEGSEVAALLLKHGPFETTEAIDYVLQACEAIAEAHRIGIVHRDLKPANLFLTRRADGSTCLKVLDFGISKTLTSPGNVGLTNTHEIMGSPLYMSPEQMRTPRAVDTRTDLWSLGVILFELLTNDAAFEGETVTQVCAAVLEDPPPKLCARRSDAPRGLEVALHRCLEKNPDERFQDVAELADALAPFASEEGRATAQRVQRIATGSLPPKSDGRAFATERSEHGWGVTEPPRASARKVGARAAFAVMLAGALSLGGYAVNARYAEHGANPLRQSWPRAEMPVQIVEARDASAQVIAPTPPTVTKVTPAKPAPSVVTTAAPSPKRNAPLPRRASRPFVPPPEPVTVAPPETKPVPAPPPVDTVMKVDDTTNPYDDTEKPADTQTPDVASPQDRTVPTVPTPVLSPSGHR